MPGAIRRAAAAGLLCLGAGAACRPSEGPGSGQGAFEAGALDVVARYDEAWMKKDLAAIRKILAPSYVYFSSRGGVSDLARTLETVASPGYRLETGRRDGLKAYRFGETVVVDSHWVGSGVFDGQRFEDDQRCSIVVAFAESRRRVLSEHCTNISIPPK